MHSDRHRRRTQMGLVAILIAGMLVVSGCAEPYKAAAKVADDLTKGVSTGINVVAELQRDGLISTEERNGVLRSLDKLTDLNGVYKTQVRSIHAAELACAASKCDKSTEYIQAAQSLISAAKDPAVLGAFHVSNIKAQAKVTAFVNSINLVLDGAVLAIQKVKGR